GTFLVIPAVFLAYILHSIGLVWLAVPISELITTVTAFCIYIVRQRRNQEVYTAMTLSQTKKIIARN
ncbi:MAG: hypothetical protein J6X85_00075, partial [Ruminococcus sp.]|nr:hypothetical protein [Ruminococcus sp.]